MHKFIVKSSNIDRNGILKLVLAPRRAKDRFEYQPGQYAAIGFRRLGRPSPTRCFSIVSSPYGDGDLEFAIKVHGPFTQSLSKLVAGNTVYVQGPYGHFTIDEHYDRNIVMLAGGIGITPFMSMIRASTSAHLPNRLFLLYSNPLRDSIPFHDELLEHERNNPMFGTVFFVTQDTVVKQQSERMMSGRVSVEHLAQLTGGKLGSCTYFICGPKGFIKSYQNILAKNGVPRERIVAEEFSTGSSFAQTLFPRDRGVRLTYALATIAIVVGSLSISALDLVRYVPAKVHAEALAAQVRSNNAQPSKQVTQTTPTQTLQSQSPPTAQPTQTTSTNTPTPTPTPTAPTQSPVQSTTPSPTPTTAQQAAPPVQTYQPPVTSVS
jgi:ferredoxin-NADP reductase